MREPILFIITMLKVDEDAKIVGTWSNSDAGPCEFGAQLIESPC